MLAEERHAYIYDQLMKTKAVKIDELAQTLDVASMTIRRDLDKLADRYANVRRCHGGAVLSEEVSLEDEFELKQSINTEAKIRIARRAFSLINDHDTIYLDAGTTTMELARLILASPLVLTVVTNDIEIARILKDSVCDVIMTGGILQKSTGCLIGSLAEELIGKFRFRTAFMGATAINEQFDVLTPSIEKRTLKPTVLRHARRSYLLVDSSKFNRNSTYVIYSLSDFSGVITDLRIDTAEQKRRAEELGIQFISV